MSVSVRLTSAFEYLSINYPELSINQIPPPLRDKTQPSNDYLGSPYELIESWGFFSSPYAFTISYRKVPIRGVSLYEDAVSCVMEPRPMSFFRKVTALGSTELVAKNACSAQLIAMYAKMPDYAISILIKFLTALPRGANLLFAPTDLTEMKSFLDLPEDRSSATLSLSAQSKSLQLSRNIERAIYSNDADNSIVNVEAKEEHQTRRDQNSNNDTDNCSKLPEALTSDSQIPYLEPLRSKLAVNQQLKNKQMKEYAWILNRANLCRDERFVEFHFEESMTPEEFMEMEPVPNTIYSKDFASDLTDVASCIPSVAVKQMKLKDPNVRYTTIPTRFRPKCTLFPPKVIHLTMDKKSTPIVFFASCKMLAFEAAAAKYLQLLFRHTETPQKLLWNYLVAHFQNTPLILFRARSPEQLAVINTPLPKGLQPISPKGARFQAQKVKELHQKPNLEVKNNLMRRRAACLRSELKKLQSECGVYSVNPEFAAAFAVLSANEINDSSIISEVFDELNNHPYVNSITLAYVRHTETEKLDIEITLNDIYVFGENMQENCQKALLSAAKKAKVLMKTIEKRGCEDVIPYEQRNDTKLLIALIELKTGLSVENIPMQFTFNVENKSWIAETTIDGVYYGTNSPDQTQNEALSNLLSKYLIEKHSCLLLKL